jgi:hypothetical protein
VKPIWFRSCDHKIFLCVSLIEASSATTTTFRSWRPPRPQPRKTWRGQNGSAPEEENWGGGAESRKFADYTFLQRPPLPCCRKLWLKKHIEASLKNLRGLHPIHPEIGFKLDYIGIEVFFDYICILYIIYIYLNETKSGSKAGDFCSDN